MPSRPTQRLETFVNPARDRDYRIHMEIPEFTCVCPMTGQPDFATLLLEYVPDRTCVELKSLKLYIWSYRDQGAFHEAVTNRILDDLVAGTALRQFGYECVSAIVEATLDLRLPSGVTPRRLNRRLRPRWIL